MEKLPKIVKDSSYRSRGGTAKWLLLSCGVCKFDFSLYQKDGQGNLFRLYLDRLFDTDLNRPFRELGKNVIRAFDCSNCNETVGIPMLYEKDDYPRVALRLVGAGANQQVISRNNINLVPDLDLTITMKSILEKG